MQPAIITSKDRLLTVDALRGIALLGIMIVHYLFWHTAGPLPQEVYARHNDIGSGIARFFSEIFLAGKFFAFFSFLFGLSFYLQTESDDGSTALRLRRFAWRITLLLVIGLLHHALWQGDILSIYAPLGFLLLFSHKLPTRWLLITGVLLALNLPGKVIQLINLLATPTPGAPFGDFDAMGKAYDRIIREGNWLAIAKHNWQQLPAKYEFQVGSGRLFITFGFFLLGAFVGRKQWFRMGAAAAPVWKKLCKKSVMAAGACLVLALSIFAANELGKLGLEQNPWVGFFFSFLFDTFGATMVTFYVSGLSLLALRQRWQKLFSSLAPVGKMALTSYLVQSLFGLLLFWGIGAGLYSRTSPGMNFLIAVLFFIVQVCISAWWMKRFCYGPVEWLWRSGTVLQWQPFKRRLITEPDKTIRIQNIVTTIASAPKENETQP